MIVNLDKIGRIAANLRKLGEDIDGVVDTALGDGAQSITDSAKSFVEIQGAVDTGELVGNIVAVHNDKCQWVVSSRAPHSIFIEYGTGNMGDPSVAHTTRYRWVYYNKKLNDFRTAYPQPARPFMRPAFAENKNKVVLKVSRAIVAAALKRGK